MQDYWREHHAGNPHKPFAQQQSQQRQPDGGVDSRPDDLAVEDVFQLVYKNQEGQGPQSLGWRDHEPKGHHQGVAHEVADHRNKAAKKSDSDRHHQVRKAHAGHEDSRQHGVDGRDGELRFHDHVKAAVKGGETLADFFAAEGIQIMAQGAGRVILFQPRIEKQPNRHQAADNQIHKLGGGPAREVREVAQIARLAGRIEIPPQLAAGDIVFAPPTAGPCAEVPSGLKTITPATDSDERTRLSAGGPTK